MFDPVIQLVVKTVNYVEYSSTSTEYVHRYSQYNTLYVHVMYSTVHRELSSAFCKKFLKMVFIHPAARMMTVTASNHDSHKSPPLLLSGRDPGQVESDSNTESVLISKVIPISR